MNILKKITTFITAIAGIALMFGVVLAAPGDDVQPPIPKCGGIGVAYDGTTIWYTCAGESKIRKTDLAGADLGFIDTAEGLTAVSVDAIAWDANESKIWGGELVDTDGVDGNDTCRIYSIDPVTGAATTRFDRTDLGCGSGFSFFDGLTVDTVTDTLYYSPDVQKFIHHLTKGGVDIGAPIDFETLTSAPADRCPSTEPFPDTDPVAGCNNSGLTIGLDGTLFAGTNGEGKIMSLDPTVPALLSEFANVDGRDEDLECGPVVDGKETILSKQFEGPIDVLEAPKGTCVSPVRPLVPMCVETVNPHGKKVPPAGSTTLPGPKGGQNEDGFYELSLEGKFPVDSMLWVTDAFGSGPFGPFSPGNKVKITEAPGATPSSKKMGSTTGQAGAVVAHITLKGDALVFAVDPAGNRSDPIACLVPPPPK